jgi:hypothetical protein
MFACRHCGQFFPVTPGADLHCSPKCARDYETAKIDTAALLVEQGFALHGEIPNLFVKDGVHVSLEQVMHEGFQRTLEAHSHALAARNAIAGNAGQTDLGPAGAHS